MSNEYKNLALEFLKIDEEDFKNQSTDEKLTTIFNGQRGLIEFQCAGSRECDSRLKNCRKRQWYNTTVATLALAGVMWGKTAVEEIINLFKKIIN